MGLALPRGVHAWALGAFALLTLALALLYLRYANVNVWEGLRASGELRQTHYSETVYVESIFRTRANTWSNLAFVLAGLYAIAAGSYDRRGSTGWLDAGAGRTPPALTALFGVACCYLGLGSGIFHASLTRWGQQLDVASMYPPMLALIALLIRRDWLAAVPRARDYMKVVTIALIALVAIAAMLLYIYKWSMSSGTVLPLHVLALAACFGVDAWLWRPRGRLYLLGASFLALVAGVTCRQLDVAGHFSGPDAWCQGHALWHGFCGLSLALGWLYTRSGERQTAQWA